MRAFSRRDAFTLLEVMAAVLVLGLLYAVLAEAAIRGLHSEGVSRRRVEASLIADRYLSDLEESVALGQVPPSGKDEDEVDVYRVGVSVEPFDPTPMLETIQAVLKERGGLERKPQRSARPTTGRTTGATGATGMTGATAGGPADAAAAPAEDLLAAPRPGQDGRLRRIDVTVVWQEGDREEQVSRTTFAFDRTGLDALFPEKQAGADAAAAGKKPGAGKAAAGKAGGGKGRGGKAGASQAGSDQSGSAANPFQKRPRGEAARKIRETFGRGTGTLE